MEILDEATEEPITEPGVRGRVVVTNLFRTLMPIIRYPVGDLAEWVDDECRAFRLVGRTHEGARVANVAMSYVDVHAALLAADHDEVMAGMQMVERRWDGKDGLVLRLAGAREPSAELDRRLVEATYRARPLYRDQAEEGHIHPLTLEWVRPGELVDPCPHRQADPGHRRAAARLGSLRWSCECRPLPVVEEGRSPCLRNPRRLCSATLPAG